MSSLIFLTIFFIELISLFFLSKLLHRSLAQFFYSFTHSQHKTVGLLAFVFLPGTVVHELAHVLVAGSMLVESEDIEFMPEIKPDGVKLGSAQIHKTDPIRRSIIGVAPVLVGISLVVGISWYVTYLQFSGEGISWWVFLIMFYLIFEISNTMFSSNKDLEGTLVIFALISAIFIALYFLGILDPIGLLESSFGTQVMEVVKRANIFLLIPIILDLVVFGFVNLMLKKRRY